MHKKNPSTEHNKQNLFIFLVLHEVPVIFFLNHKNGFFFLVVQGVYPPPPPLSRHTTQKKRNVEINRYYE